MVLKLLLRSTWKARASTSQQLQLIYTMPLLNNLTRMVYDPSRTTLPCYFTELTTFILVKRRFSYNDTVAGPSAIFAELRWCGTT